MGAGRVDTWTADAVQGTRPSAVMAAVGGDGKGEWRLAAG